MVWRLVLEKLSEGVSRAFPVRKNREETDGFPTPTVIQTFTL